MIPVTLKQKKRKHGLLYTVFSVSAQKWNTTLVFINHQLEQVTWLHLISRDQGNSILSYAYEKNRKYLQNSRPLEAWEGLLPLSASYCSSEGNHMSWLAKAISTYSSSLNISSALSVFKESLFGQRVYDSTPLWWQEIKTVCVQGGRCY